MTLESDGLQEKNHSSEHFDSKLVGLACSPKAVFDHEIVAFFSENNCFLLKMWLKCFMDSKENMKKREIIKTLYLIIANLTSIDIV